MRNLGESQAQISGAYGFRFSGLQSPRLLTDLPTKRWPVVYVERGRSDRDPPRAEIQADRAEVGLEDGGIVELDRSARWARFLSPEPLSDEDLLQPHLGIASGVFARWSGWESFHSGVFVASGRAWALLGDREAGKSTMVAWLALAGHPITTDDLLVVRDLTALSGPRFVDLRDPTASALDCGDEISPSRLGMRRRLALRPVPHEVPLGGWIFLAWGPNVELRPIPPSRRLERLASMRAVRLPPTNPSVMLELAALPAWELRRPKDFDSLPVVADRLLDVVAG